MNLMAELGQKIPKLWTKSQDQNPTFIWVVDWQILHIEFCAGLGQGKDKGPKPTDVLAIGHHGSEI